MIPKPSIRQRKFFKAFIETKGNLAESARRAGSKGKDTHSLSTIGGQLLASLELTMPELLNAQGLTDDFANKILMEGLEAEKIELATFRGKFCDERVIPDKPTRGKYLEIFHRLRGNFIDRHELTGRDGGDIVLSFKSAKGKQKEAISIE